LGVKSAVASERGNPLGGSSRGSEIDALNAEQRRVVEHDDGPLLVLAGPGSGKTRVLVERFVRLVGEKRARSSEILALAYNSDAAAEMARRVTERLGVGDYAIATFHAFAKRALEELGWMVGVPSSMRLLGNDVEKWQRLDEVLSELRPPFFYSPTRPRREIKQLLGFIARAKQESVPPERIAAWAERQRTGTGDARDQEAQLYVQAASVYDALETRYARDGVVDYEDLILKLAAALRDSAALREVLSARYRYVMVDEFQDTDHSQSLVLERLVAPPHNLVVVADDDQSIYRFRGASLANVVRFQRLFPDAPRYELGANYRCPPPIVEASAAFVALYAPREAKRLSSAKAQGPKICIATASDLLSEAAWIAAECRRLVFDKHVPPTEVAVLARAKYQLEPIAQALSNVGLPYDLRGGGDFFSRDEVKDLLALLRAAVDPTDDLALIRLWRLARYRLSGPSRARMWAALRQTGRHVIDATDEDLLVLADDTERERFVSLLIVDVLEFAANAHALDVQSLVASMLHRTEHVGVLARDTTLDRLQAAANLRQFIDLVATFAGDHPGASVAALLGFLELAADAGVGEAEGSADLDGIRLSSAHSAKGLEFRHVFIASAADRRFPVSARARALEVPTQLVEEDLGAANPYDEERRLFYVAMTRASESLAISYAESYYEGARAASQPSRFIADLRATSPGLLVELTADPVVLPPVRARVPPTLRPRDEPLTITQLLAFSDCPRQFQYAYEVRLPRQPTRATLVGTLIHSVLEQASVRRINGHDVSEVDFHEFLEAAWQTQRFDKLAWADLKDEATRMLDSYVGGDAWRDATILEAEREFSVELVGFAFHGRFDRVERRHGRLLVIDYKTGRTATAEDLRSDRQFGFYRLAAERVYSTMEIDLEAHYLASGDVVAVEKDAEQLDRDSKWVYAVSRGITDARRRNEFITRPSDFTCPPCPFRIVCDEGREFLRARRASS
jgi:DNA helicase-2/ATP-dependent DNA helicase PcrA